MNSQRINTNNYTLKNFTKKFIIYLIVYDLIEIITKTII